MQLLWRDITPGNGPAINTSLTDGESAELRQLAKGKRVLEVGSAYGYSAVVMALGGAKHITAVDPHAWLPSFNVMEANLRAYNVYHVVDIMRSWSFDVLPTLSTLGHQFDLIFIDGDHSESTVTHDVEWAERLLAPSGVLACHDYDEVTCPGVRQSLDAWKPFNYIIDTLAVYTGLR